MTSPRLVVAAALLLCACSGSPAPSPDRDYVLVELVTGPRTDLDGEATQKVFQGHMANIQKLAAEKKLLVAGPYGKPKHDAALRGVFIFDTADVKEAEAWTATDPGVVAGVFAVRAHTLKTDAPLRAYLERELADVEARRKAGGDTSPGANIRGFVMLTAPKGAAARPALATAGKGVLLHGVLDGQGLFAVLDAEDVEAARPLVAPAQAHLGEHHLDGWWSSKSMAQLWR